jgi:4-hydroxy-L-threonine phosphate dehydrogenase PdxA
MKKKIIIVSGDPNSINSELIFKMWNKVNNNIKKKIYLISNFNLIKKQFKILNYSIKLIKVEDINENIKTNRLKILNVDLNFKDPFKVESDLASKFVIKSLNYAHKLGDDKGVIGIINCAINKKLLIKSRIGVTEYLASKCKVKNNSEAMLIRNSKLSVCPITTHIDVKQISKKINKNLIVNKTKTVEFWLKQQLKRKPKIGILGLNPHNAELRKNSEEKKIIIPAILKLKKLGMYVTGPLVADTTFIKNYKNYDVIIGMFHDQVIVPFKSLYKFDAINITLGLKYLRLSPDHGTAIDLIKKKIASASSLIRCVEFLSKYK